MAFTAQDVAKLRETTGAGMMECKKALTHTDGNMEKAAEYLREQGINIAEKKSNRLASEGAVSAYISGDGLTGALAEVNCESDFVARGDEFLKLGKSIAEYVAKNNPKDLESCLDGKIDGKSTVKEIINAATAKIGEKISLRRFVRQQIKCGLEESYLHMGGRIGVLLEVETSKPDTSHQFKTMCHDIAMHIAAFSPKYVNPNEVPKEETEHEKSILKAQIINDPKTASKPQAVIDKMIEGRISKFFKEICLVEQDFAKDPSKTVSALIGEYVKASGVSVVIKRFTIFVMGEGLEKKNENFAEEIAKMQGK